MTAPLRLPPGGWLEEPAVRRLFEVLDGGGESLRAVGGPVRNALLGRPVVDIDFATTATPDVVTSRAEAAGLKAVPTGVEHGTVTVVVGGRGYEVTTLRADIETDGRHAKVAFGRDWAADAARRDFTVNALYADANGTVHDPLGGYPDLVARRIRFIGDADTRIREDALRILRFFRFTAEYAEGPVDPPGLAACIRQRRLLDRLSRERVRQELLRLLAAARAAPVVQVMAEAGLAQRILRGVPRPAALHGLRAVETALGLVADPILALAALAVRIHEDAERLAAALRLTRGEATTLLALSDLWREVPPASAEAFLYRHRRGPAALAILLAWAVVGVAAADPVWAGLHAKAKTWQPPSLGLKGADLVAMGLDPGPAVGEVLASLEEWWVQAGFPGDPALLNAKARELVEARR